MTELEQLCENALYDEMRVLEDGKSVVRDIPTGKLYFKKTLDVYNEHVYAFLKDHRNKNVAGVQAYWKDGDKLVVIEELIQGRTLDEILQKEVSASAGPANDKVPDGPAASEMSMDKSSTVDLPDDSASANAPVPPKAANAAANAPDRPNAAALTFSERIDILAQICDGLQFLHSADPPIIHRDIKASNIMVTDDAVVKIIDYDAAKIYIAGQDKDTMMIGTQGLAAPEQYGFAQSNVRTDLYALGKLIERMLPDNADAKRIVEKATEMDPKKRYTSAAQMKSQIQKIREKPAFLDQKFEKIPGFDPMNKSHRTRARIALAAAVLAIVLLAGALGWRIMVYPVRQEEALRAELSVISASEAKDGQLLTAVEVFAAGHPYNKMNGRQKKAVRDEMMNAIRRCFKDNMTGKAQQIRDILTKYYGDEALWETVYSYGKAESALDWNRFADALDLLHDCREEGAVDADEYWESGVARTLKAANSNMETFREKKDIYDLKVIAEAYGALFKYDAAPEEDFDKVYQEILAAADEFRKAEDWEKAQNIYKNMRGITTAIDKELEELDKESRYESAESAFAKKAYNDAKSKYSALGDYKDSAEKAKESVYLKGQGEMQTQSYEAAVADFMSVPGYKDADDRAQEAKYLYCQDTQENPTNQTYNYIEKLLEDDYEGAEELRDEIYKWRVSITTGMSYSFGPMQSAYLHATLIGGPPDATTTLTFRIDDPTRGEHDTYTDGEEYKRGDVAKVSYSEEDNSYSLFDRTYKVSIYADGGELIGTWEGQFSTEF